MVICYLKVVAQLLHIARSFFSKKFSLLGLGKREDASRRHPYRASSPSRAGHVTVARSMTNPTDGNWYENECVSTGCLFLI